MNGSQLKQVPNECGLKWVGLNLEIDR